MEPATARRRWSVTVEKTVRELRGFPCIEFEDLPPAKKEIATTRSFGRPVTELSDLIEAVTEFASRAAEKLRKQNGKVAQVLTFVHTSPFRTHDQQYSRSITVPLRRPTADTGLIVQAAVLGMRQIFKPGLNMAKAGVHLLDIQDGSIEQEELDLDESETDRSGLMTSMDSLNRKYGKGTITIASAGNSGLQRAWVMRQELRTPDYTTCWDSLAVARA